MTCIYTQHMSGAMLCVLHLRAEIVSHTFRLTVQIQPTAAGVLRTDKAYHTLKKFAVHALYLNDIPSYALYHFF